MCARTCVVSCATTEADYPHNAIGDISKAHVSFPSNYFNARPEAVFLESFLLGETVEQGSYLATSKC